jgi:LysR family transcriptional regulator, regulator for metE and metH
MRRVHSDGESTVLEVADLKMLSAVAKCGNLTRAAVSLNTTQSALSHRLATLEDRLGTLMFERLGRTMKPTPAGAKLAAESEGILQRLSQATTTAVDEGKNCQSTLRLATQCYTFYSWLPSVLTSYRHVCPHVKVDIVLHATYRLTAALLESELDVGITTAPVRDSRLRSEPLFEDELLVIMPPDHPLAKRTWIGARDLCEENLITYDFPFEETSLFKRLFKPNKLVPKNVWRVPLTEAIIDMVKAGLGVSVLARWAVAPHLLTRSVCSRPITSAGLHREWHVAMRRTGSKRAHQVQFIEMLREQLRKNGDSFRAAERRPRAASRNLPVDSALSHSRCADST